MKLPISPRPLRALYIEDDPRDVRLYNHHLEKGGFEVHADTVVSAAELSHALRSRTYDIILADHGLPNWSGIDALDVLRNEGKDIPLILVSGSMVDSVGVESIKRGATDYILKDRLARLAHAVERALAERAARAEHLESERARDLLASLVESSDDAIMGISPDGALLTWNRAAARIYGYEPREILGRPFSSLFAPQWVEDIQTALVSLRSGSAIARHETLGLRKNGGTIDVAVTVAPIRQADGVLTGAAAVVRDITDYKNLREQFFFSQKMEAVGKLAAGVAHDFNNLLTVISGYSSLALGQLDEQDPVFSHIREVLKSGERAAALTRQLLAFSRKQILQPRLVSLNEVVAAMDGMLRRVIQEDIVLETVFAPALGVVRVDPGQMEQVVMNLAVNARDAMPLGGTLRIETANVDAVEGIRAGVMLSVSDTGTGMDRATQARIFEPFFTTKGQGGTGLGLSTVFGIVGQSGGVIRVESEPGQGTTFRICLPRVEARDGSAARAEEAQSGIASGPGGSETVLVVEDEDSVRSLASRILRSHGYHVLTAANGSEALRICEQDRGIDLVVTDAIMPVMNGAELTARLRTLDRKIAILLISGHTDSTLLHQGVLSADIAFLQKPFTPRALASKVREVLDQPAIPAF